MLDQNGLNSRNNNSLDISQSKSFLESQINSFIDELPKSADQRIKKVKAPKDSRTEHTEIVMSRHANGVGRLFGGALLQMIDTVGAICARRHAETEVTTVAIDHLTFKAPAKINSTLVLVSEIVSVGRTSMKVKVSTYVEQLDGHRQEINTAHVTFVALDRFNLPTPVPRLNTTENK